MRQETPRQSLLTVQMQRFGFLSVQDIILPAVTGNLECITEWIYYMQSWFQ